MLKPDTRYLIAFHIAGKYRDGIQTLMNDVSEITGLDPPHFRTPPHITVCPPMSGVDEEELKALLKEETARARRTVVTLGNPFPFGKQYIVLPVHTTFALARLWIAISTRVSLLDGYMPGPYVKDNSLHVTIAKKTSSVFDLAWPAIRRIETPHFEIPIHRIILYRKQPLRPWEAIDMFHVPK